MENASGRALRVGMAMSLILGLTVVGCGLGRAAYLQQMHSPNALDRSEGIRGAVRAGDPRSVQQIVALLDDPEPAVRMFAAVGLRELTGEDFGFRFYADAAERQAAIERWQQALREGRVVVRPDGRGREVAATQPAVGRAR